jgi:hypothetical protein
MMGDPKADLDKTLAEFLSQQSDDKRKGYTIANIYIQMQDFLKVQRVMAKDILHLKAHEHECDERHAALMSMHEELASRVEAHDDRLDTHRAGIVVVKRAIKRSPHYEGDEHEMDTGTFDLAAIQRKVDEQEQKRAESERVKKDDATWLKRHLITVAFAVMGTGIIALATFAWSVAKAVKLVP